MLESFRSGHGCQGLEDSGAGDFTIHESRLCLRNEPAVEILSSL